MGTDIELAVLFSDVVGSTRIYEILGDQRAREIVSICIDLMRASTEQHRGTVIKTMGDEVMATFSLADDALNAAAQIQRQITSHPALQVEGQPVAVRIGCHFGPVVVEARDVFGATVHTANRMTSQAKAGQIMTTAATIERLSPEWRSSVRQIDVALLKGQGAEVSLYEAIWQTEDVTSMLPSISMGGSADRRAQRLRLSADGSEVIIDEGRQQITIGRADENDLVIRGNLISRIHARVEISRGKFLLIDQSTNGTFVLAADGEESFVRRDSMQLKGEGMIGLGKAPEGDSPQTIRYVCEES
ncbi:MAG TPA: adenylate/guanylate cyclase domain-containing protein [Steroidobacteraceae bacterium]|nr:adenylate/guanylate cyclase domain-containing protein [Steroidobacteraceae bacterium]